MPIPDNTTFSLQNVVDITGGDDLTEAFVLARDIFFDPAHKGDKNNLLNFRNYNDTLISGNSAETEKITQLVWAYNDVTIKSVYLYRNPLSAPPGLNSIHDHFEIAAAYQGGDGGNLVTNDSDAWDDGTRIDIRPKSANNSAEITGTAVFGLEVSHHTLWGTDLTIQLVHEDGTPPSVSWVNNTGFGIVSNTVNSGLAIGSTSINYTVVIDPNHHGDQNVVVTINSTTVCTTTQHFEIDGTMPGGNATLNLSQAIAAGDTVVITIGSS